MPLFKREGESSLYSGCRGEPLREENQTSRVARKPKEYRARTVLVCVVERDWREWTENWIWQEVTVQENGFNNGDKNLKIRVDFDGLGKRWKVKKVNSEIEGRWGDGGDQGWVLSSQPTYHLWDLGKHLLWILRTGLSGPRMVDL